MKRLLTILACAFAFGTPAIAATPVDSRAVVDSVGVNLHSPYNDTPYWDRPWVKSALQNLKIRHVRDNGTWTWQGPYIAPFWRELDASGIKVNSILGRNPYGVTLDQQLSDMRNAAVTMLEGDNEPDLWGDPDWIEKTRAYQLDLWQRAKGDSAVLAPSFGAQRAAEAGDFSDRASGSNIHPYPGADVPEGPAWYPLPKQMADVQTYTIPGGPVYSTENGYHNAVNCVCGHEPVSEKAAAAYAPRLFMEAFRLGVKRTYWYELVDMYPDASLSNPERHFGLYRNDRTLKPSGAAIKNLIALLDSGPSARTPLDYSVTAPVRQVLTQKSDGTWWLAMWNAVSVWNPNNRQDVTPITINVGLSLPFKASRINTYRPTLGTGRVASVRKRASISVPIGGDLTLVEIVR